MSRLILRLGLLAVILAVVLSAPSVERERRASKFTRFFSKVGKGIKTAATTVVKGVKKAASTKVGKVLIPFLAPIPFAAYKIGATIYDEAGLLWRRTDDSINNGNKLVDRSQKLTNIADDLERSLGNDVGKRATSEKAKGFQNLINTLRKAAQRVLDAGKKVVKNSDKIKAAFQDAVVDISEVVSEGVADVGGALSAVGESITEAGQILQEAKTAGDNVNEGLGNAIEELKNAGELAIEAGQTFEEVGERSLNLAKAVIKMGKNLVEVFAKSAKNIVKASGITGRK